MARALLDDDAFVEPTRIFLDPDPATAIAADEKAGVGEGVAFYDDGALRLHGQTGYDEEGSPVYGWRTLVSGKVALNLVTVNGVESGTAMILTTGAQDVTDDAVLFVQGARFETTKIARYADRVELEVTRAR